ncbi:MAG: nucleotidyltransferase domain-containing protein [Candidatus Lokiarchaeota archaeon]|nr:nucleotidyltransferase domain-containing protein [Candidatus Lokiarchaeota archaeon]
MDKMLSSIRSEILDQIQPTDQENQKIKRILSQIKEILKNYNKYHHNFRFDFISAQGSTGIKQTHLRHDSDIDLFIFLNPKDYEEVIEQDAKNRTKISALFRRLCDQWVIPALKADDFEEVYIAYAEHPYVSTRTEGYEVDIVFSFFLPENYIQKKGPITAVDRTFYHSEFIQKNLGSTQLDDVRILKAFFKNNYSYGDKAPIARGGFIGYAAELLICYFGSIWNIFRNFHTLPYISVDFFNRSTDKLRKVPRFQNDFLLIMDPTDKMRNVAASISERAWIYCSKKIESFLKNPSIDSFFMNDPLSEINPESKEINSHYVVIENVQISDSHYTKIRDKLYSIAESVKNVASKEFDHSERFPSVEYSIYFDAIKKRFCIAFYTSKFHISDTYMRRGPKTDRQRNFEKFKAKHPDLVIKEGYSYVEETRTYTNFLDLVSAEFKGRTFKEIEIINISIPKKYEFEESIRAVFVLKECILPYRIELDHIVQMVIS